MISWARSATASSTRSRASIGWCSTSRRSSRRRWSGSRLRQEMQHSEFVHLHVHSNYSLLDGAAQLEKLFAKAKEFEFPAIALPAHANLFAAIDFYLAAKKAGFKPILG